MLARIIQSSLLAALALAPAADHPAPDATRNSAPSPPATDGVRHVRPIGPDRAETPAVDSLVNLRGGPPENDSCEGAHFAHLDSFRVESTAKASPDMAPACILEPAPPARGILYSAPGLWFYTVGTGYSFTATTCSEATNYNSYLSVFCGSCSDLTCVAANNDAPGPYDPACDPFDIGIHRASSVTWCTEPGAVYYILVWGVAGTSGTFGLELIHHDDDPPCTGALDCPESPIGACCPPFDCVAPSSCTSGEIHLCGGDFFCGCFESTEGDTVCIDGRAPCGSPCPGGTADCPGGEVCVLDTCCDEPVCLPPCHTLPDFGRSSNLPPGSADTRTVFGSDSASLLQAQTHARGLTGYCFETSPEICDDAHAVYAGDGTYCDVTPCCEGPDLPRNPAPPDAATAVPLDTVLRWNPDTGRLFGVDTTTDQLLVFNTLTGAAASIGSTAPFGLLAPSSLAWTGSTMYSFDLSGDLYSLNLINGRPQLVAQTDLFLLVPIALAADPTDNAQLYAYTLVGDRLYRVNLDGSASLIASGVGFGSPPFGSGQISALTFDGLGRLWGIDCCSRRFGLIDKFTGDTTLIATSDIPNVQAIDFDAAGTLWAHSDDTDTLYTINIVTGEATPVGPSGTEGVQGIAFTSYPGVPTLTGPLPPPLARAASFSAALPSSAPAHAAHMFPAPSRYPTSPSLDPALRGFPGFFIINFDDAPAPCVFAETTRLDTAYAHLGVVFEGPGPTDGGAILDECSGFGVTGHTPPNFLAFNSALTLSDGGVPAAPEFIRFGEPMQYVSLRAGSGTDAGQPLAAAAYNSLGLQVDIEYITLAADLQFIQLDGPGIVEVVIDTTAAAFVIDDLVYSACPEFYRVFVDTLNPPTAIACDFVETPYCALPTLDPFTTYYWRVDVFSCCGSQSGPVWSFTSGSGCPGTGDCCTPHASPGCESPACCEAVCNLDPFCCETEWDSACADEAHSLCQLCPFDCPGTGDCCQEHTSPGCDDPDCCQTVCKLDPYCCTTLWDSICAEEAAALCSLCPATCPCADFTGDNLVNLVDFVTFQVCFGATAPNPDCPPEAFACADLNADGRVNLVDFVTFQTIFFLTPDGITPPDCLDID